MRAEMNVFGAKSGFLPTK